MQSRMKVKKKLLGFIILAMSLWVSQGTSSFCGNQLDLRVNAKFYERSQTMASSYSKSVQSSSTFQQKFDSFSAEASAEASGKIFSGSASGAFEKVSESVESSSSYSESISHEQTEYNTGFLQILREVTTELSIDGSKATVVEETYVDSVPIKQDRSQYELNRLAENYIAYEFGNSSNDDGGEIMGSTYINSVCMGK